MADERKSWLDSWCRVKQASQQDLARHWATRNEPEPEPIKLRPLRRDEKPPVEFSNRAQQEAFEAYAKKYWYVLRVPDYS